MNKQSYKILTKCSIEDQLSPSLQEIYKSIDWSKDKQEGLKLESYLNGELSDDLTLSSEDGNFLLLLFQPDTSDPCDEVVSLNNPNWKSESIRGLFYKDHPKLGKVPMVEIGGNYWDARTVTTDIDVVKSIFKEFFETGKITHPWMQSR